MDFEQLSIFDFSDACPDEWKFERFHIGDRPIRLIEMFGGIGSQAMALRNIGANFTHHKLIEFDKYAVASYNAIHGTNFKPVDICDVHAADLEITDTDIYIYICCYSFPCQDLSIAGLGRGMQEDSGTRSSLLWEVKRILSECEDLPQVLVMENVPMIHADNGNMEEFKKWIDFLNSLGYTSNWQDMDAQNYGIPQSRNRTFMVSILGKYTYKFPNPIPLEKTMRDYLEDEVEEKFYLKSEKAKKLIDKLIIGGKILTDRQTDRQTDS